MLICDVIYHTNGNSIFQKPELFKLFDVSQAVPAARIQTFLMHSIETHKVRYARKKVVFHFPGEGDRRARKIKRVIVLVQHHFYYIRGLRRRRINGPGKGGHLNIRLRKTGEQVRKSCPDEAPAHRPGY